MYFWDFLSIYSIWVAICNIRFGNAIIHEPARSSIPDEQRQIYGWMWQAVYGLLILEYDNSATTWRRSRYCSSSEEPTSL